MQAFLPRDNVAVDELVNELSEATWKKSQESFTEREGTIHLPKFRLEYDAILNGPLQQLGIKEAFTDQADFTNMVPPEADVYLRERKQTTVIEVDEGETEAAVVTSAEIRLASPS